VTNVFASNPHGSAPAYPQGTHTSSSTARSGHEQVVFCQDTQTGLRAIIAIYSTALGPALGGTRFFPYPTEDAALSDVLNLSRAMAYKNALADLDLGGGKAVIIGDPAKHKTEALLRAYGRFIESLGGRYITACDIGTYSEDMDIVARESRHVTGRTVLNGGGGDSSVLTAVGVFHGMRAAAEHAWGSASLEDRVVGIDAGARVVICDVSDDAIRRVQAAHPGVQAVSGRAELLARPLDIYSPCAMGGALNDDTVAALSARIVCGGANNQLAHPGLEKVLADRGILYAPDYLVNAGGVIQVADELSGFNAERAAARAERIFVSAKKIFALADEEGVPPAVAADRLAERRMAEVGRLRGIWLGS
jgi:valine dehydrogenase (NAD+)